MARPQIQVQRLGLDVDYDNALELQTTLVQKRQAGEIGDQLLVLQHRPVITIPRDRAAQHLLVAEEDAEQRGVQVRRTNRGGDITYHGPGQWVLYPIVKLEHEERDVRRYVDHLEQAMIDTCAQLGISASRKEGLTGCWVGDDKIGAIGVRFSRWVASHGIAFNETTNLEHFRFIVPCGIASKGVCSLESLGVRDPETIECLVRSVTHRLGREPVEVPCASF